MYRVIYKLSFIQKRTKVLRNKWLSASFAACLDAGREHSGPVFARTARHTLLQAGAGTRPGLAQPLAISLGHSSLGTCLGNLICRRWPGLVFSRRRSSFLGWVPAWWFLLASLFFFCSFPGAASAGSAIPSPPRTRGWCLSATSRAWVREVSSLAV